MPIFKSKYFQERNSIFSEHLRFFHDHIIIISILILYFIFYWILKSKRKITFNFKNQENNTIEIFWTVFPIIILIFAAIPSIIILFISEEESNSNLNIKILGNQWYWEYEIFRTKKSIKWQCYINKSKIFRNLITSNLIILPNRIKISSLISSYDVIHSWRIPSISKKCDAIPGRINLLNFIIKKRAILSGQCSEICGINHRFIPIFIKSIRINKFYNIFSLKSLKHQPLKLNYR